MKRITAEHITLVLFWIAFASLLGTSIPHVAWLYQIYEPNNWYSSITSYGIAIGIDVMIAWLSFVCSRGKAVDKGVTIVFIVLLALLSNYANYLYDMAHSPVRQVHLWDIKILFGLTTTGYLTPLIISAVPFFALGYTFMLEKISRSHVNLEELESQLENKQRAKLIREKYKETDFSFSEQIKRGVSGMKEIIDHTKETFNQEGNNQANTIQLDESSNDNSGQLGTDIIELNSGYAGDIIPQTSLSSTRNVSLEIASELLETDIKTVRHLISKSKLKTPATSSSLVTRSSIEAYIQNKKRKRGGFKSCAGEMPNQLTEDIPTNDRDTEALYLPELLPIRYNSEE